MAFRRDTDAIVAGRDKGGSLVPPIWTSTTWESNALADMAAKAAGLRSQGLYSRYSNPTVRAFEEAIATLEHAEDALAFGSGMGAIATTVFALCSTGSHIVAQRQIYGGTRSFLDMACSRMGIEVTYVDATTPGGFAQAVQPGRTMLVIAEVPSNPLLELINFEEFAQIKGPFKLVDSTVATPLSLRPLTLGADIVMHSATKGIGGHNDALLGVIAGERELIDAIWAYSVLHGSAASPTDAHNALRGIRTLPIRTKQQSSTALALAKELESHEKVSRVYHLGMDSHPQFAYASEHLDLTGTLFSFELKGGLQTATTVMDRLQLIRRSPSFGGPETLICHPSSSTHAGNNGDELSSMGITEGLLRISVGLEDVEDLWADLSTALS